MQRNSHLALRFNIAAIFTGIAVIVITIVTTVVVTISLINAAYARKTCSSYTNYYYC